MWKLPAQIFLGFEYLVVAVGTIDSSLVKYEFWLEVGIRMRAVAAAYLINNDRTSLFCRGKASVLEHRLMHCHGHSSINNRDSYLFGITINFQLTSVKYRR